MHLVLVSTTPEGLLHGGFDLPFQRLGLSLLLRRMACCCAEEETRGRTKLYQNMSPAQPTACMRPTKAALLSETQSATFWHYIWYCLESTRPTWRCIAAGVSCLEAAARGSMP